MPAAGPAVLVFDRGGDVLVFLSIEQAAGWMESTDVIDGEYEALFTLDGRVVAATGVVNGPVSLLVTDFRDDVSLRARLRHSQAMAGFIGNPDDPVAVANELLRAEWERRWPRRPRWLDQRLHGDGPAQV